MISGLAVFGAIFKSKNQIQVFSFLIALFWFIFSSLFSFSSNSFISYINLPAFFLHLLLIIIVMILGFAFRRHKVLSAVYGIIAILVWSVLVDTIDYFLLFPNWNSGFNYFAYVWNGIVFNAPKCLLPMAISFIIAICSISYENLFLINRSIIK